MFHHIQNISDMVSIFNETPSHYLVLDPHFIIFTANDAYLNATSRTHEQIVGRHIFEAFPDNPDDPNATGVANVKASLERVVDTRKPDLPDVDEPLRVASAVAQMRLQHAVLTMVARDDLPDSGFGHVAECINQIRHHNPGTTIETLVSDAKGDVASLQLLFDARPDVFNHNIETVARLQRAVRPSAGYARSLGVLAAAKAAGLVVKSGLVLGMGETSEEVDGCLADLAGIGVNIVTIGQYLRPTTHHTPVARWIHPDEFTRWKQVGESLGIGHVESSPLTRSSYHAKQSADAASDAVPVTLSRVTKS